MPEFKRLDKDVLTIKEYFEESEIEFCDISAGVKYMWRDDYVIEYAIVNDTLILKENNTFTKNCFYYPMGKDVSGAIGIIENYCKKNRLPLVFCYIDDEHVKVLSERYPYYSAEYDRAWCDYIYDAESFIEFRGKKYGGQRNHINKFKKLYPDHAFRELTEKDLPAMRELLAEYETEKSAGGWSEYEEEKAVHDYVENAFCLSQLVGGLFVGEKLVGLSVGERVKDTLIVHVEKALKRYEGAYPTLANEFAGKFATGLRFINREEDCGDEGLRISKTQYHPVKIAAKYVFTVTTAEKGVSFISGIKTERLTVSPLDKTDAGAYFRLYTDEEINEFYGYDYREDCKGEPTEEYFYNFQKDLKTTEGEYSFAVKKDGALIGEVVAYNFGFDGSCEIGYRFLKEFWGKGYAFESVSAFIAELKTAGVRIINARTKKENVRSERLLNKLGLKKSGEDSEYFYYGLAYRENANG